MVAGEIDPRLRYQSSQPRNEIYTVEGYLGRSIPVGRLLVTRYCGVDMQLAKVRILLWIVIAARLSVIGNIFRLSRRILRIHCDIFVTGDNRCQLILGPEIQRAG
ncbi:MAG: hypothetical protein GY887_16790 [Halieaceae bacterium]|nr:hypothetical protein [Halieaceae bacterium]MCP4843385.1 hypothetical protein [Halieaceae bacterium]